MLLKKLILSPLLLFYIELQITTALSFLWFGHMKFVVLSWKGNSDCHTISDIKYYIFAYVKILRYKTSPICICKRYNISLMKYSTIFEKQYLNFKRTARHTQSYLTPKHAFNIVIKILLFSNCKTNLKVREKRVSFPQFLMQPSVHWIGKYSG